MALLVCPANLSATLEDAYGTAFRPCLLFSKPFLPENRVLSGSQNQTFRRSNGHVLKVSASMGTSQRMEMEERLSNEAVPAEKRMPSSVFNLSSNTWSEFVAEDSERELDSEDDVGGVQGSGSELFTKLFQGKYERELEVAVRAVQLACTLTQPTQERILRQEEKTGSKADRSLVTVADWGVQAVISRVLSQSFGDEEVLMIAEEDTKALKGMDGIHMLQRVVDAVNECLRSSAVVGLRPLDHPLGSMEVLKAINKGACKGGPKGRYWVLDPVDGTLGFVRGDQYAIALSMIEDGEVVLAVLGCPNYPIRKEWLRYHHRYYRLMSKLSRPNPNMWHKGCIFTAQKGCGSWMQPLLWNLSNPNIMKLARPVCVSAIDDPAEATFCEPVEKANSSHSFTAGLASSIGLKKHPLRVYSMAKYGAIARGDAEIFMKFARSGYREKIWDHAAGVLIVQEAGGVVTDAGGKPLDFSQGRYLECLDRGIIACSGKMLHNKLMEAVDASWNSSRL